jgi:hypothetical protein
MSVLRPYAMRNVRVNRSDVGEKSGEGQLPDPLFLRSVKQKKLP